MTTFQKIITAVAVVVVALVAGGGYVVVQQQASAARAAEKQAALVAEKHRQERADKAAADAEKEAEEQAAADAEAMVAAAEPEIVKSIRSEVSDLQAEYVSDGGRPDVGCVRAGDTTYECAVEVDMGYGPVQEMYEAQVDPTTGKFTWEATDR